ncbi:hypothetical protein DBR32_03010 [Taibaiella sp. KBW10]|uniref:ABC transporter permease n=1 Tax=Taibaiella sp. KBW10 TaxID=2153357 RepID=UPI000F5A3865|nr:ABC transporter permease [Taibaiella sp. KBW10]RQO32581.1 hypothetical protein DBR32_03010 [Taibaiella sp. KBW10]
MTILDLITMARKNLWRTRLRTLLTLIGVIIGIGALISMVSFGIGLEKNITQKFKSNDLFTSLTISAKAFNFKSGPRNKTQQDQSAQSSVPLNDSLIAVLQKRPEVAIAYPRLNVPVRAALSKDTAATNIGSLPMAMAQYPPYNQLYAGHYFSSDTALEAIVSLSFLQALGYEVVSKERKGNYQQTDTSLTLAAADTIIGKTLVLFSVSLKSTSPFALMGGIENAIDEKETRVKIVGILKEEQFAGPTLREEIILPINTAKRLPSLGFDKVSDLINNKNKGNQYTSIYVKTKSMDDLNQLKKFLDHQKINYFAIDDGLAEMKKAFLILDSVLGIIGLISLLVAGFGIVNTMLMSIMERTREIGIMKAVGGKNKDIRMIFFFEAGFIGLVGAFGGIALGYGLTRVANLIVNNQYLKNADEFVDLFSFPWWLIGGSVLFSIIISLLAGLYPAIRASSIHPIDALRQTG